MINNKYSGLFLLVLVVFLFADCTTKTIPECPDSSILLWTPSDSIVTNCESVTHVTNDTFICVNHSLDSILWFSFTNKSVFKRVALPNSITKAVSLRISPTERSSQSNIFLIKNSSEIYLLSNDGQIICDYSKWATSRVLELYGNNIHILNDSLFLANVDFNCLGCKRPDSAIALFLYDSDVCSISIKNFLLPAQDRDYFLKYYASWSPYFFIRDSLLFATYSIIDTVFIYNYTPIIQRLISKVPITSTFYTPPYQFSFEKGFYTYGAHRKALTIYNLNNSWIREPVVLNDSIFGVMIDPIVPESLYLIPSRPSVLWLKTNNSDHDIIFKTALPIDMYLGSVQSNHSLYHTPAKARKRYMNLH